MDTIQNEGFSTLSGTMRQLRAEGYTEDFNLGFDHVSCRSGKSKIFPSEFEIDKFYRFEGDTDPADEAILYAISSKKHNIKGLLVNGYGIYSEPLANEIISKLDINF